jgi:hypothetical protein
VRNFSLLVIARSEKQLGSLSTVWETLGLPAEQVVQDADSGSADRTNIFDGRERDSLTTILFGTRKESQKFIATLLII